MSTNLLSPIHIQKLGHPIEEIRMRALNAILSKYNLELVDSKNYENSKLLLEKLLNWFNFEKHPYEDKVFKLIIKILKEENIDFILKDSNQTEILKKLNLIEKCVDLKFMPYLQEIKECMEDIKKKLFKPCDEMKQQFFHSNSCELINEEFLLTKKDCQLTNSCISSDSNDSPTMTIAKCKEKDEFSNENEKNKIKPSITNSLNELKNEIRDNDKVDKCLNNNEKINCNIITEYFSWQPLVQGDSYVLASIYEGLRYIDNINSVVHSCQFFNDILLKDFPAEIFVQRPLIIQTFLELLQSEVPSIQIPTLKCLIAIVKQLHYQLNFASSISLIHSKPEFYGGLMFKNKHIINKKISQMDKPEKTTCFCSSESDLELETDEEVMSLKSQQLSLSQFCFSVLSHTIPHLSKKKSVEEINLIFELILEIYSLIFSMNPNIKCDNSFKKNLYTIFNLFHDSLKYSKKRNRINHSIIVYIIIRILNSLKISEELQDILPHCIQFELVECISDYIFILLFPNAHSEILHFARKFLGQRKKELLEEFEVLLKIRLSMKSAVEFMKNFNRLKNRREKLNRAQEALLCVEFHKNYQFITDFVNNCLLKWSEKQLNENEIGIRRNIILKLLSHQDEEIKFKMYREIHFHVIKHLGVEEAMKPKFTYPGNKFNFLFDSNILSEIICHGLTSSERKIQEFSSEILVHILKGKFLFSDDFWQIFITALVPTLPLLQCYADKATDLGRCIIKMLDPDISKTIFLSPCDLIKGNLRLLFSKNHLIREEAFSRLFWLLTKEDPEKQKLPRLNLLRGINLSSICSSVTPEEYSRMNQKFYNASNLSNVLEMLCADNIEPSMRRSALSQISVMLDDVHLHSSFLEENGLQIILEILANCLVEKEFKNYPDSVIPVMNILKLLCLHNPCVRLQLSQDIDLYYSILRSLLLFNSERKSRQNGVELLCLLLYNECIINIQDERAIKCRISLPQVVVTKICLPFLTHIHWRYSKHTEPSIREGIMMNEKLAKLLRIYWCIEWFGNISQILSMEYDDLKKKMFSPDTPKDMIITCEELKSLKNNSLAFSIRKRMYDIQNATTHEDVMLSLHSLTSSLLLYDLDRYFNKDGCCTGHLENITASLLKLPWELTFKRYLLIKPSCEDDEMLLYQIIRVVRLLLKIFKSEDLILWIGKLLTNGIESLPNIIKSYGKKNSGLIRRDLTRAVIELIEDIIQNVECSTKTLYSYIALIVEELQLNGRDDSYNIAYVDWLISLLADLTGKPLWNVIDKTEFYETVITRTMDVMVALYCSKDSQNSFLGINTIRNCLYIFNHILGDMHSKIKGWEHLWYQALSQVIGHKDQSNYSWLLSLWYVRDPIIRALTIQLLTGFCLTCQACELLMEQLNIKFEYVWNEGFKLFLDDDECSLVREKAALLLSNLTSHGSIKTASEFLKHLLEIHFYEKLLNLFESLYLEPNINEIKDTRILNQYCEYSWGNSPASSMSSPSLISAVNILLLNILFLDPSKVSQTVLKTGILEIVIRNLSHAPEVCEKYKDEEYALEIIKMYTTMCTLLAKSIKSNSDALTFTQQSEQFIASLYCLVNFELFNNESEAVTNLRNKFWCEILDLLSVLLTEPEMIIDEGFNKKESFKALNQAMTENGTDYFISSLYLAITSNSCDLRLGCIHFLNNLFVHEANRSSNLSILDIIDRNIVPESATLAEKFSWNGYSLSKVSDLNFGKRICDSLLQTYNVCNHIENLEFKKSVPITLGSLLAISENAQNYCIELGFARNIIDSLKTAFIKLSLENIENLNKISDKKRIDPILSHIETSYKLISNLFSGNQKIKSYFADLGLSSLVHKLWYWCLARDSLLSATLKMLCTFTLNSKSASRTLVMSKTWTNVGLRKSFGSTTLLNSVIELIEKETDLISKTQELQTLRLLFQLLENCCSISECRCTISKSTLLRSFTNVNSIVLCKKRIQNEDLVKIWFNFFSIFTAYQEGLLTLIKYEDVLDEIISAASVKNNSRYSALKILRNLCFHQLNRIQLLSHYPFLSVILQVLKSNDTEDIELVLQSVWALTCNSQKGKSIIRNAGVEELVGETKKKLQLTHSFHSLALVDIVLRILNNK